MATKIFVNVCVQDLKRSKEFFAKLGYEFNAQFTDDNAASMVISEDIYAMLLTPDHFKRFITSKQIADSNKTTEAIIALSHDSKDEVKAICEKAFAAGGKRYSEPNDHGFMYQWGFEDPDGHIWEQFWMDPSFVQK